MAEVLVLDPALVAGPLVRVFGIHGACGIQVAVRLLGGRHDGEDAVDVGFELLVRVELEDVAGAFDGLVHIGVVKGVALDFETEVVVGMHLLGGPFEIQVTSFAFTLGEGERDGHFAGSLETLAPESVVDLDAGEGDRIDRIAGVTGLGSGHRSGKDRGGKENQVLFHIGYLCYCFGVNLMAKPPPEARRMPMWLSAPTSWHPMV